MALAHVSILVLGAHTNKPCTAQSRGRSLLPLHPAAEKRLENKEWGEDEGVEISALTCFGDFWHASGLWGDLGNAWVLRPLG